MCAHAANLAPDESVSVSFTVVPDSATVGAAALRDVASNVLLLPV